MTSQDTQTAVAIGAAVAGALAPLGGPEVVLAEQLLAQGLAYWADFAAKKAAGTLTMDDVNAAAAKTGADLDQFAANVAARKTE